MKEYKDTIERAAFIQSLLAEFFSFCDCDTDEAEDEDGVAPLGESILSYQQFYKAQKANLEESNFLEVQDAGEQLADLHATFAIFVANPNSDNYLALSKALLDYQHWVTWMSDLEG
ncbi:MAG: hypothetical protein ACRC2R_10895 [Xenococcaceae cyanobacterium]